MSSADVQPAPPPALPDYLSDPDAVLKDTSEWRYGRAPDYSKTRTVFEKTKKYSHEASSLPSLVENLVKNWEIEASFKPQLSDWRTVDRPNYSFAINGGPPQTAEYMLKVGTYNAIISPNEFYSPAASDFASSHKTFKRMMPTFAWEVMEVYSGPPRVAFRWRHWGEMKNDYVGFNDKGEKITAKAHNGPIDIEGVTVAQVDDQVRLQKVETWFDPLEMFRQIAPNGIVNREAREPHHGGEINDQGDRAAQTAESNAKSQIAERPTSTTRSSADIPQSQNAADSLPQPNTNPNEVSGALDLATPSVTQFEEKSEVTSGDAEPQVEKLKEVATTEINRSSTRGTTPESDSIFQNNNPADGDDPQVKDPKLRAVASGMPHVSTPAADSLATVIQLRSKGETGTSDPQLPSDILLNRVLQALESVQSDFRQFSTKVGNFEARISKLEGVSSNGTGVAPTPGNAVAVGPESEQTRQTHEEMSRISAGECPFLTNKE